MNRERRIAIALVAPLALTACHVAPATIGRLPTTPAMMAGHGAADFHGGVQFTVHWPVRRTQTIPSNTSTITVSAYLSGQNSAYSAVTVNYPGTGSTSTASLTPLPPGPIVLQAVGEDSSGAIVAEGSTTVTIPVNGLVSAALTMQPSSGTPTIQTISPTNGLPGTTVVLYGSAFGAASNATYSVEFGNTILGGPTRLNDSIIDFAMPAGLPPGSVSVIVAGATASISTILSPIASVSLGTSSVTTFEPGGEVRFTLQALDVNGNAIASPDVSLNVMGEATDDIGYLSQPTVFLTGYTAGTASIVAGTGSIQASTLVTSHLVDQDDAIAAGLMALPSTDSIASAYYPATDPYDWNKVTLGKTLFDDPGMAGGPNKLSCSSCHILAYGMEQNVPQSITNTTGVFQRRKAPSLLDIGYLGYQASGVTYPSNIFLFWDGRADNLEDQADDVFNNPQEIDMVSTSSVETYLQGSSSYVSAFDSAFGPGTPDNQSCGGSGQPSCATLHNALEAIATFERELVTPQASFDQWISAPNGTNPNNAMSASALVGLGAFLGFGHCAQCHNGPDFSDDQFHAVGAGIPSGVTDTGRAAISGNSADTGKFRTANLRNVGLRADFFHAGLDVNGDAVTNLTLAVKHYENVSSSGGLDPKLPKNFNPDTTQEQGLVDFLSSLTGATPSITP